VVFFYEWGNTKTSLIGRARKYYIMKQKHIELAIGGEIQFNFLKMKYLKKLTEGYYN